MSKPKFTPGPWAVEDPLGPDQYAIVQDGLEPYEWQFIATIPVGTPAEGMFPRHDARANACLISAAPDMYVALVAGVAMREAQAAYFRDRSRENLIASKEAERAFDKLARTALALARGER